MVQSQLTTSEKYAEVRRLVDQVGLSIVKACARVGLHEQTYYWYRKTKDQPIENNEAGGADTPHGTTRTETPGANPHKDTPASLAHTKEQ